jgi:hypothetical protein
MPEKFKLEDLNHEELLRFRAVSTACCTSQAGAHIFGIIGIVLRASSEHISSVKLRAMAKQLDGSDLMDKPNRNGARGVCLHRTLGGVHWGALPELAGHCAGQ